MSCDFSCDSPCARCGHRHGEHLAQNLFSEEALIFPTDCWGVLDYPCEVGCPEFVPVLS